MTSDQYRRAVRVFQDAIGRASDMQVEYVKRVAGDDEAVCEQVLQMLKEDRDEEGAFSDNAIGNASAALSAALAQSGGSSTCGGAVQSHTAHEEFSVVPEQIGPYRVIRKIAEGGMGVVYEAEQPNPRRTVALKVIREGWFSVGLRRRFEHEVRVLGQLEHPGIARIYDAGTTEILGRSLPYFAMEFVQGQSLLEYARSRDLSTRGRLALMMEICHAVNHAHQKGVIHRDIKPANIMVTGEGHIKILDFGVARAIDSDLQAMTVQTEIGQMIGTIPYMSPEQVKGVPSELDTRSDVYALGVVCFELLSGQLPYDVQERSVPEAARIINDEEPTSLSSVARHLRGDIETIVSKALSKQPFHRYQSAADLAADINRHLRHEPIEARPPTALYQLARFAQRNKALAGAAVIALAALVLGSAAASYGLIHARRERDAAILARENERAERLEAQRQASIAEAVNQFLTDDLISAVKPDDQGIDVSMRKVLATAAERIEGRFSKEPIVEAAVRYTLGETYVELGQYRLAQPQLERALDLRRMNLGADDVGTIDCVEELGVMFKRWGKYDQAETYLREGLDRRRMVLGPEDESVLEAMNDLAACLDMQGKASEAAAIYSETLSLCRRLLGEEHVGTLTVASNLAVIYGREGRFDEEAKLEEHILEIRRRTLGNDSTQTLLSLNNLGLTYTKLGRYNEAEKLLLAAVQGRRKTLGENHPYTLWTEHFLVELRVNQKRLAEAESLARDIIQRADQHLPQDHWYRGVFQGQYGKILDDLGRDGEAVEMLVKGATQLANTLGMDHRVTQALIKDLVAFCDRTGRTELAESWRPKLQARKNVN